jgi:uncharacterized iron-regulated membrane protein
MAIDMTLKKWIRKLHLWLGLASGLVVFILGLTGAIYCFAPELQDLQPYRHVAPENRSFLPPSQIKVIAENRLPDKFIARIYYDAPDKAVMVLFLKKDVYNYSVFLNPYSGKVLKLRNNDRDFISVVLQIHRTLLIPYGHEIIRWSTVIFIAMLFSGIILWWPKHRRTAGSGFRIMWKASPKRFNYDLHKVLGFYISWIVIFSALTGLMFAFEGFADFIYRVGGSAGSVVQKKPPLSDTSGTDQRATAGMDRVWSTVEPQLHRKYASTMFVFPATPQGSLLIRANPDQRTLYKTDFLYFDQYNGREIPGAYVWGAYQDARVAADHIRRMNYDIHTGALFGLPGRIALFFVALITTSLPITGFLFWWGRKHKRKNPGISTKQVPQPSIV